MSIDYEGLRNHIEILSLKAKDDSIKQNASASENAGLHTRVTRIYDNVGVHNRKDDCEWCLSRCGVDMTLQEAYEKGSFERHPGCGCEILYKTSKGTKRQTNWTNNTWTDVDDDLRRTLTERRKQRMAMLEKQRANQSGQIQYHERIRETTRSLIESLVNEFNTRLKTVTVGAEKAAGDTDMAGVRIRLSNQQSSTVIHEFAHTLANTDAERYGLTNDKEFWKEIKKTRREYTKAKDEDFSKSISFYANGKDVNEFFAEAFAHAKMREMGITIPKQYGEDFTYSQQVLDIAKKYFGKRKFIK